MFHQVSRRRCQIGRVQSGRLITQSDPQAHLRAYANLRAHLECCSRLLLAVETSLMWPMSNLLAGPLAGLSGGRPRTGCGLLLIAVAFVIAIVIAVTR